MIRRAFSIVTAIAAIAAGALSGMASVAAAQTVVVVRHAEKGDDSADPDLSEGGQARARALAEVVAGLNLDRVIVSPLRRTAQTAEPAALAAGVRVEAVALDTGVRAHVGLIAARARETRPDDTVLIVGHSNTVPLIARELGAEGVADMDECEYDRLIVLTLTDAGTETRMDRYGAPTQCDAS